MDKEKFIKKASEEVQNWRMQVTKYHWCKDDEEYMKKDDGKLIVTVDKALSLDNHKQIAFFVDDWKQLEKCWSIYKNKINNAINKVTNN